MRPERCPAQSSRRIVVSTLAPIVAIAIWSTAAPPAGLAAVSANAGEATKSEAREISENEAVAMLRRLRRGDISCLQWVSCTYVPLIDVT